MALQQFSQVDLLLYEKREKEVAPFYRWLLICSATYGQTMIQQGLNQNYKYAMYAEHIYLVSTTIDVSPTISLEKYSPIMSELTLDASWFPDYANRVEKDGCFTGEGKYSETGRLRSTEG